MLRKQLRHGLNERCDKASAALMHGIVDGIMGDGVGGVVGGVVNGIAHSGRIESRPHLQAVDREPAPGRGAVCRHRGAVARHGSLRRQPFEQRPVLARQIFERAVDMDPANAEASYNLGIISYAQGDRQKAVACFRRATEADSLHARAFYNLAIVLDQLGMNEQAMAAMIRAARLGYKDAQDALTSRGVSW